jgi:hypothetical protein
LGYPADRACHGSIICIPSRLAQRNQSCAIEEHRQRITLCHALFREYDKARFSWAAQNEHNGVAVAVECKLRSVGPSMLHSPEHGLAS